jgi:UDP-GlcNAc:undecaprenyl-phosphate/decaprenyl-phosphate GlcNAc-1-phosphate transferase
MLTPLLAFSITLALCPVVLLCLRRGEVLDVPGPRSSHDRPTPRGGGLAVAVGCSVALAVSQSAGSGRTGVLVAACLYSTIGLLDDVVGLSRILRFGLHLIAALLTLPWLLSSFGHGRAWVVVAGLATVVWLVGYVNVFNFMDGINGISVSQALVAGSVYSLVGRVEDVAVLTVAGATLAAGALAFAPFNFPRARMFLGDVGSYFMGAWLAALAVYGVRAGIPPETVVAPLAVYLGDAAVTMIGRLLRGEPWLYPHRDHVYQRLVQLGWSHTRTTLVVAAAMVAASALGLLALTGTPALRLAAAAAIVAIVVAYLRVPTWAIGQGTADGAHRKRGRKP